MKISFEEDERIKRLISFIGKEVYIQSSLKKYKLRGLNIFTNNWEFETPKLMIMGIVEDRKANIQSEIEAHMIFTPTSPHMYKEFYLQLLRQLIEDGRDENMRKRFEDGLDNEIDKAISLLKDYSHNKDQEPLQQRMDNFVYARDEVFRMLDIMHPYDVTAFIPSRTSKFIMQNIRIVELDNLLKVTCFINSRTHHSFEVTKDNSLSLKGNINRAKAYYANHSLLKYVKDIENKVKKKEEYDEGKTLVSSRKN